MMRRTAFTGAAGYTYTYDADGNRVEKSNSTTGTIYWYMSPGIVAESDLTGNLRSEYLFFNGQRTARKDFPSGAVSYYFSDHLRTAHVVTDSAGTIKVDEDLYPWGGELQFVNNDSNHYKFTSKERDAETQLDYFGARYYGNWLGRFITPDWSEKPQGVPYALLEDPQTLNLYSYVRNSPLNRTDPTGHYEVADPHCGGDAKCQQKYDKLFDDFDKQRQKDLRSKDPNVRAGAAVYGERGEKNGIHVGFADLGKGIKGYADPFDSGKGRVIDIEVRFNTDLSGSSLAETIAHEGTHVADQVKFLTSYDFSTGKYNQDLNPPHIMTELRAYTAGAALTREHGFGPGQSHERFFHLIAASFQAQCC